MVGARVELVVNYSVTFSISRVLLLKTHYGTCIELDFDIMCWNRGARMEYSAGTLSSLQHSCAKRYSHAATSLVCV